MKTNFLVFLSTFILCTTSVFAQAPKSFNYQGVARDASGQILGDKSINLKISILSEGNLSEPVYIEEHQVKTNKLGLFSLKIGQGLALLGDMEDIEWGSSAHYVSTEMDVDNNGHFALMGTAPLLSVPYALYAEKAGSSGDEYRSIDFSGAFGQTIRHNGNDWEASSNIYNTSNNVGVGTTSPSEKLDVNGNIKIGATNQIVIGNNRGLAVDASRNIMQGNQTGFSLTSGSNNNFMGHQAGKANTSGNNNSFIGYQSGLANTTGSANSFYGYKAGGLNTTGSNNFYSGLQAGYGSTTGINNIAIGTKAGFSIGGANDNTFVGREAGLNTTNNRNTFIGKSAGDANTSGAENTYIGYNSDGADTLVNATAIGANATVNTSNSLVLGNNANVGIGSSSPVTRLDVTGNIRMVDGNQQAGFILTSDTGGIMSWTNPLSLQNSAWIAMNTSVRTNPTLVDPDYDFVFGSTHLDYNGDTTYAERFFFDKSKGAFRAGAAIGTQWDDTLRGDNSIALGFDVTGSGDYSVAIGDRSRGTAEGAMALGHQAYSNGAYSYTFGNDVQAWADSAFAIGTRNKAFGRNSFAIGVGVRANAKNSVAVGFDAQADSSGSISLGDGTVSSGINSLVMGFSSAASEENSIAIGRESFATAQSSIAFGDATLASGYKSFATGFASEARGDHSTVLGNDAIAEGDSAIAVGHSVSTDGRGAVALGSYLLAPSAYETVLGRFNTFYIAGNDTIWQAGDRLLTVGNGTSESSRSDAMVILKNGRMGIGTSSPSANVEISSGNTPTIRLDQDGTGFPAQKWEMGGNEVGFYIKDVTNFHSLPFRVFTEAPSNSLLVAGSGNVGIGTNDPIGKLHVVGSIRMVDGNQATGRIPVSSASGVMTWTDPSTITTTDDGDWEFNGNHLYNGNSGNVGIGTSSPTGNLEVSSNDNPSIRLDQDGTGFPAQKWEMSGNEVYFNIRDVTNGNKIPFRLHTNAATNTLVVTEAGNIGVGSTAASAKLDVSGAIRMQDGNEAAGYIPVSDASGVMTWTDPSTITDGDWTVSGSDLYSAVAGNVGIGTISPEARLHTYSDTLGEASGIKITQGVSNSVIYQNSNSDLILRKSNQTDQLVLDSGGNIGIGTSSPTGKLHIFSSTNPFVKIGSDAGSTLYLDRGAVSNEASLTFQTAGVDKWAVGMDNLPAANQTDFTIKTTNNSDAEFVIKESGHIGIATIAPATTLDVNGTVSMSNLAVHDQAAGSNVIQFQGTADTDTWINFRRGGGAPTGRSGAMFSSFGSAHYFMHHNGSNLIIAHSTEVSETPDVDNATALFALKADGNLGLGSTNPQQKLDVTGSIRMNDGNQQAGYTIYSDADGKMQWIPPSILANGRWTINGNNIYSANTGNVGINSSSPTAKLEVIGTAAKTGGGSWAVSSDRRLKKDIQTYNQGLDKILAINPVTFHYNEKSGYDTEPEYVGVIAQELQKVAPDMVSTFEQNGMKYLRVDNSAMTYMLINAVKEQQQIIEEQKVENEKLREDLELENQALKTRLEALERLLTSQK